MAKPSAKTVLIVIFSVILVIAVYFAAGIIVSGKLKSEEIFINQNGETDIKVLHISDLHYPKTNVKTENIVKEAKSYQPDLIFLTGDIIDSSTSKADVEALTGFLYDLTTISPVYAVLGNHETINDHLKTYKKILKNLNISLLENEVRTITVRGANIIVAGVSDNYIYDSESVDGLNKIKHSEDKVFLLAHRPEKWERYLESEKPPFVTFSGHAHGGQIQIFGKGIYAPAHGFFPKYYDGYYRKGEYHQIVSRGLGDSIFPFRMYNSYHLPKVTVRV